MKRRAFTALCLGVLAMGLPFLAHAETLDDTSVRALYAQKKAVVGDPDKTSDFMDDKLDDFYTLKSNMTQIVDNAPPKTTATDFGKAEAIDSMVRGYSVMKLDTYESKITDIRYSNDRQFGYVTTTTASSGTVSMPLPGGGYRAEHYQDGEACVDQVGLVRIKLKILQSACNEKLVIGK